MCCVKVLRPPGNRLPLRVRAGSGDAGVRRCAEPDLVVALEVDEGAAGRAPGTPPDSRAPRAADGAERVPGRGGESGRAEIADRLWLLPQLPLLQGGTSAPAAAPA